MPRKPIPKPSILDSYEYLGYQNNQKLWRSRNRKRYYTWDSMHGEVEVFDRRGYHLGSVDPRSGGTPKGADKGRRIDVT